VPARTAAQRRRLDQLCEWLNITERHARKLVERNAIPYRKVGHLRWGELAELRAGDLDLATGILTVSRTVVELDPKFHPDGRRFLVKPYPKTTKYRRLKLSRHVVNGSLPTSARGIWEPATCCSPCPPIRRRG
jgi:hypothetical protein